MTVGSKIAGLRLVADTLEMLDAAGSPRLRVAPPYIVGADGVRTDARLAVLGCAVDTDPSAPWGRRVKAPGAASCTVQVSWNDATVAYPALLDPRWTTTGSMTTARQGHTATVLSTGKVLVVGGTSNGSTALASAELFDRTTGTWATTGSITGARTLHAAVQLGSNSNGTTSGKVLVTGGLNGSTSQNTAQLYSVSAGTWVAGANLNAARHGHTATVLASGSVLVAGGLSGTTVLNTAATYNPGGTGNGSWTAVGNMATARRFHTATLLTSSNTNFNNKVLVVGGNSTGTTSVTSVQLFDGTSAWSTSTVLPSAREGHTATFLANGQLLVTGGKNGSTTLNTALLFTVPASGTTATWTATGNLTIARQGHAATLLSSGILASGQVLVTGGSNGTSSQSSGELWNGTTWTATSTAMAAPVQGHTASLMANGAVLIAGGVNGSTTVASAQLYDPSFALTCTTNSQCSSGFCVSGVCCNAACTDQCSACNLTGLVGTCSPKANGTTCNDGNACTQTDTCQAGTCTGDQPDDLHRPGPVPRGRHLQAGDRHLHQPECADGTACNDGNALHADRHLPGRDLHGDQPGDLHRPGPVPRGRDLRRRRPASARTRSDQRHDVQRRRRLHADRHVPGGHLHRDEPGDLHRPGPVPRRRHVQPGHRGLHEPDCVQRDVVQRRERLQRRRDVQRRHLPSRDRSTLTDNNPCTTDTCDPVAGVTHTLLANGTACSDGNACTLGDTCEAGTCTGTPIACPGGACHPAGTCDVATGLCSIPTPFADGTSCDDGNRCSIDDTCQAGTCIPGDTTNGCTAAADTYYVPVVDLGSTQGASHAKAINEAGEVVGGDVRTDHPIFNAPVRVPSKGFHWTKAGGVQFLPPPAKAD